MATKKVKVNLDVEGSVEATSFVKTGGTSSQYLLADGSVTTSGGGVTLIQPTTVDGKEGIEVTNGGTATVTLGLDLDLIDANIVDIDYVIGVDSTGKNVKTEKSQFFAYNEQAIYGIDGDGSTTTFACWHDLGLDLHVQIFDWNVSSPYYQQIVYPKVEHTSSSNVQVTFNTAPATGQDYRVLMNKINSRHV